MNRYRVISSILLTLLFCFFGIAFSYAQELELTPQYYDVKSFKLKSGEVIEDLKIEYATLGTAKKDSQGSVTNAVVFCHGFSGNYAQIKILKGMVGPGKPFDTDRFFFILPTAIGSPGSSCPSISGLGPKFPKYTIEDMVSAQYLLVTEHLDKGETISLVDLAMQGIAADDIESVEFTFDLFGVITGDKQN